VTTLDWIAVAVAVLAAVAGLRRGLLVSALSLGGVLVGAVIGGRIAPHLLPSGSESPYTPLVALAGAVLLGGLIASVAGMAGSVIRRSLFVLPPLKVLDSLGGLLLGAAAGLTLVWVLGVAALQFPNQVQARRWVQESQILSRVNERVPPRTVLNALARIDPFPSISGPAPPAKPLDRRVLRRGAGASLPATTVAFDRAHDIAVLRVSRLHAPALRLAEPEKGRPVAILGFPENGPFDAQPGRVGVTAGITAVAGRIRHGNSGSPAVDASGAVQTTIFAARIGSRSGYGVATHWVGRALARVGRRGVSTGSCGA
jgi:uncharacterized membrane protein required for colicin V production